VWPEYQYTEYHSSIYLVNILYNHTEYHNSIYLVRVSLFYIILTSETLKILRIIHQFLEYHMSMNYICFSKTIKLLFFKCQVQRLRNNLKTVMNNNRNSQSQIIWLGITQNEINLGIRFNILVNNNNITK
jgi:hypothetical protein